MAKRCGISVKQLNYKKKQLQFSKIDIATVAKKHKTPFYLYSEDILTENYQTFYNGAVNAGLIKPLVCFALKSNPNKELVKVLAKLGSGADIVSGGELKRALEAGIPAEKIVFSGVGKTEEEIIYALKLPGKGINSFNVESLEELELINACAKKLKKLARICFRLNPVVNAKTHKNISTGNKTHKFGLLEKDVLKTLGKPKYWSNSNLVGLSIHIGSQLLDLKATKKAIQRLCEVSLKTKANLEFIDVGGGLGIDYHPSETKKLPTIDTYMQLVAKTMKKHFYSKSDLRPAVVFEPGRRIIAQAGIFVMSVIRNKVSEENTFVIVDGGMNDFMRPSLYDAYHAVVPVKEAKSNVASHVVGPICETSDCFGSDRMLPSLKTGDLVILKDTGAYGYSMGSNYNLRGRPLEILIEKSQKLKVVNKAQDYSELT